jgi:short-subunit dehydrogenase
VVLVARNRNKAERAVQRIQRETGNSHLRFELADLSRGDAIRDLASRCGGIAYPGQQRGNRDHGMLFREP